MDTLALLCTLHADGPATLGRLRRAGCQSLSDLQAMQPDSLAELLQVPPAMARRLTREARLLHTGTTDLELDEEEAPDGMVVTQEENPGGVTTGASNLGDGDRRLIDLAMARPPVETPQAPAEGYVPSPHARSFRRQDLETEAAPAVAPQVAPLPEAVQPPPEFVNPKPLPGAELIGAVDGLDRVVASALVGAQVTTLKDLVEADPGPLARSTGINFSRIRRLQFLARREEASPRVVQPAAMAPTPLPPKAEALPAVEERAPEATDPAPEPKVFPGMDIAPEVEVPSPLEVQDIARAEVHEPIPEAPQVEPAQAEATLDLPDHPVNEFEPQSGGPMVAEERANEGETAPLGRWLPRGQREKQPIPEDCEAPEPVLEPMPPPRKFWEPKRLWEMRKNRRNKQLTKAATETENLATPPPIPQPNLNGGGGEKDGDRASQGPGQDPDGPGPIAWEPGTKKTLGWDFSSPEKAAPGQEKQARGFEYPSEAPSASTREDASGPFA